MKHPECDLRDWLGHDSRFLRPYTAGRIRQSYSHIDAILTTCPGIDAGSAYDIGCGAGFDSFALGTHFDRVAAMDTGWAAIWEARWIAFRAGVHNVHFHHADAERHRPRHRFDLVYCNIMSHSVRSRVRLAHTMAQVLKPDGWLTYAEATEGYGPMEIHRAVVQRQSAQLVLRVRQIINGFTGHPRFRFYCSASMQGLLAGNGLDIAASQVKRWNGIPVVDRLSCQKVGMTPSTAGDGDDPDYGQIPPTLASVRSQFKEWLAARSGEGFTPEQRARIKELASSTPSPYGPFLLFLLIADLVFPSRSHTSLPVVNRLMRPLVGRLAPRMKELDWGALAEIDLAFVRLARARAGLPEEPIEN